MATRLDRLLLLLESGSTPVIRRSAALQLGEVQRLHPHELNNLLSKVHAYLGSSQWETRIAAGLAVESIASNVDQWKPCGINSSISGDYETKTSSLTEGQLQIKHFDVVQVLDRGLCLLGSYGIEYDVEENIGFDDKEKLMKQKELMNKRLGLGVAGNFFQEELIKEEDFAMKQEPSTTNMSKQSIEELIDEQIFPVKFEMSAREKNRAKRKAKQQARQTMTGFEAEKINSESSDGEAVPKKYKMSNGPIEQQLSDDMMPAADTAVDNTLNMDEIEDWPFDQFCELLMHDLFHPTWEKRHGATTGLREVVKLHGRGAGRSTDMPSHLMDLANQLWLEDLAVRLVCVLALDRFGDFVSDEVVAPVRETCAQTLGVTLHHLTAESVREVLQILSQLLMQNEWEVRHGGLLGIKYLLAVRQDVTDLLLPAVLPSICGCLEDPSDDVRAVAADALLPVAEALVRSFPQKVDSIVDTLWKILVDLDDLTSSTNSIMSLLSSILSHPEVNSERSRQMSLAELVPLLWPFLRHNIMSVRRAALRTLSTLLSKSTEQTPWLMPILSDALRHIFQRCLLESEPGLLHDIHQAWSLLLSHAPPEQLIGVAAVYFGSWLCLTMQPALFAFDSSQMIETRRIIREHTPSRLHCAVELVGDSKCYIGGAVTLSASVAERDVIVVRARRMATKLLGSLSTYITQMSHYQIEMIPCSPIEALGNLFVFYLSSKSALQKLCTAYTVVEWLLTKGDCICPLPIKSKLHECLTEVVYYDEVAFLFTRLQNECRELIANLKLQGIKLDPPFTVESVLTLESATVLCSDVYESVKSKIKPSYVSSLEERRSSIQAIVSQTTNELQALTNRVQCSIAGALINLQDLPDKMNPIVRPLMDALRREENAELQLQAGTSLAQLLPLCSERLPCPVPKIVKNLCAMLCSDPKYTPVVGKELEDNTSLDGASCDKHNGILMLYAQQTPEPTRGRRQNQKRPVNASSDLSLDGAPGLVENEVSRQPPLVQRRGADLALTAIAREAGADFPAQITALWETMWGPLRQFKEATCSESVSEINYDNDDSFAQELVYSLQVLQTVIPAIHPSLYPQLISSFELLVISLKNSYTVVRHMSGRCLATICRVLPSDVIEYYVEHVLPWLTMPDSTVVQRQGCIEALALIIEQLSVDIIPFIVLLIVPVLGRISDHDQSIRLMSTNVFATLIRLLPLEGHKSADLSLVGNTLLEKQNEEQMFLEQLLDGKKICNFEITIPLNVELRRYQQEGVNWLAFLARYNLHGILCDDMGLGKTLQSLCILATDYQKREQASKEQAEPSIPPSIVICPPTLTGHWLFEVEKLVGGEYLKPLHYVGPPSERLRLQKMIKNFNLVLASYDVVRNDIDFFSKIKWNYCILDEGQIIKNSKTKISKAVKQLDSNRRLILSGTPIQNNVLELWSLFDFLMPGFLGTEKQFQACFGRPILQSRDAKSSTKEQEAGALAMEALHRQVLPFLLRRLKEDVLQDLPPKIIQDYYCDLSSLQIQLYEDFAKSQAKKSVNSLIDSEQEGEFSDSNSDQKQETGSSQSSMKTMHVFQALQYLRKVCNHPSLVLTPHHPEFSKVMNQLKVENSSIHDLHHAPKLVALKQLLNDCGIGLCTEAMETPVVNQHRVLLFCQLKMMLDIVELDLLKAHMPSVTYLRLDGSVPAGSRHQIVNRFNNDPSIDVLLLTTQVGGLGLNLTGADTVIFVEHDWNPSKDLQAMDRAHRIGQKKVVNVYRLVTRGTLEEKIMGLQRFKINIANSVINQENNSLASMGTNQLLELFRVDRLSFSSDKHQKKSSTGENVEMDSAKPSLKAILEGLDDLWDSKDYEKEYDVGSFLSSLKNCDYS